MKNTVLVGEFISKGQLSSAEEKKFAAERRLRSAQKETSTPLQFLWRVCGYTPKNP